MRILLILSMLFVLIGCKSTQTAGEYSLIVKWNGYQYLYVHKDVAEDQIEKHLGVVDQRDILVINCKECPPPLISGGNKLYKIKGMNESNILAVKSQEHYYVFKHK